MKLGPYTESRHKFTPDWDPKFSALVQLEDLVTYASIVGPIEVVVPDIGLTILVDPHTDLDALANAYTDSPNADTIGPCVPEMIGKVLQIAEWLRQNPDQPRKVIDALYNALPPDGRRYLTDMTIEALIAKRTREESRV